MIASCALGNALLLVALFVFSSGFLTSALFPSEVPALPKNATLGEQGTDPEFDRVVFMVVDALRTDFVYGMNSGFNYTQRHEVFNVPLRVLTTDFV